jgi:hypothetical protein
MGDRSGEAICLANLGDVEYMNDNYSTARALYGQALALNLEIGEKAVTASSCACAGAVIAALGGFRNAAIAIYGGQHAAAGLDHKFDPQSQQMLDAGLACLDAAVAGGTISAAELSRWKTKAEAMSLDELARFALAALAELKDTPHDGEFDRQTGA